ncbi:phosphate signaling complex protein PhoU [Brachybacterium sp. JHP9]|uniref:Phosphate-specific transport system accessory protein PhoU n=1 Tax=Brachybacterium equifaecis TaxID=2910770 RepID=A0ABT0QYF2_9MICO|nr:phosphate signaling complex protein PhoU [Brachybacterium equifaecis]MCL6422198.1 phosphate signaling complex protein PhoU [Brachybacterium equifaecis]
MRDAYQSDLRHLVEDLAEISEMVHAALTDASTALLDGDLGLAERVIAADSHIDERQVQLDEKIVELLARQSPVASDLRLMVAGLRMSSTLERMGDLAAHIAIVARRRHPEIAVPSQHTEDFRRFAELALASIKDATSVIRNNDLALAAQVEKRDDEIDDLQSDVYRAIAREDSFTTAQIVDLTLLARFYERLGDHAVSLVRRVGFLVTGDSIDSRVALTDVDDF